MASLVLKMSVSDDGAGWTVETVSNAGAHLIGATTYAGWAAYWPGASGPFAKPMNERLDRRVPPGCPSGRPGRGERLFTAPLTIEPISTIAFSGGAVAHVFAAHP